MPLDRSACLSERALELLVWGHATDDESERALAHVDRCAECRSVFERLARASNADGGNGHRVSGSAPAWAPPPQIQEFRVLRRLGRGAMGDVWLARDTLLERDVALKFAAEAATEDARQRFRAEARAVARLRHPNILAVHHAGELEDRPFLVTELLRGRSLDRIGRLPAESVVTIGADLARGLAAAHAAGVIHRDIKPGNAFLGDDGVSKLLDFGLALLGNAAPAAGKGAAAAWPAFDPGATTQDDGVAGTPAFMAPETWRGEFASRATDVYSLGGLLFALLTGRPPHDAATAAEVRDEVLAGAVPDLAGAAPGTPSPLVDLVLRCLSARREARPTAEEACTALQTMLAGPVDADDGADADATRNPYRGLLSFDAAARALFFGREVEAISVLMELRGAAFVLVVGPSGAGKSSLVRAAVVPRVLQGDLGPGTWRAAVMVPGESPVERLVQAVAPVLGLGVPDGARSSPEELVRAIASRPESLLLLVDQFEEAWTLADARARASFFEALSALARVGPRVRIVATLRSDFLARVKDLGELRTPALRAPVVLGPMTPEGLRRAIVLPARRRGVEVEPELADVLVDAARGEPGTLPLLEFALETLWEQRDRESRRILAAHLRALGGLEGALVAHADRVLARLSPKLRAEARRLLLDLVTVDRTRARREERELLEGSPDARSALDALVEGRLVVASAGEEGAAYEVAHEVLLSGWPALRGWLEAEASARQALERLRRAAAEWERLGRTAEALLGERQLEDAALDGHVLPARTEAFVEASRAAVRRAKARRAALAFGVPLLLVLAGGTAWGAAAARHRAAVARAVRTARALDAKAEETARSADGARTEALALFDKDDLGPAEAAWKKMLALEEDTDRQRRDVGAALDRAIALEPRDPAARALYADVTLARFFAAERLHEGAVLRELRAALDVFDDGSRAARLRAPAHVRVETEPAGATLTLARYREDAAGRLVESEAAPLDTGSARELEAGSYLIVAEAPDRYATRYPFVVGRAEERTLRIVLPRAADVPEGMIYVPAGRSLYGSGDDEATRAVLTHQPMHAIEVGAFLIARTEVTSAAYAEFLLSLPEAERKGRLAHGLALTADGGVLWRLRKTTLAPGEAYCNGVQPCVDWGELPIDAASRLDAEQFSAWLSESGRLPGARLCTDREWERAARGADGRRYPNGNGDVAPEDACTAASYGGDARRAGPCAVGSHPASRSPFGVDDLVGSEREWTSGTADTAQPTQAIERGSGYLDLGMLMLSNRGLLVGGARGRYRSVGVRICADSR